MSWPQGAWEDEEGSALSQPQESLGEEGSVPLAHGPPWHG